MPTLGSGTAGSEGKLPYGAWDTEAGGPCGTADTGIRLMPGAPGAPRVLPKGAPKVLPRPGLELNAGADMVPNRLDCV